jgi:hypothetical protein
MTDSQFKNVVETYLAMEKSKGVSAQAAIKAVCEATDRKYNDKYLASWPKQVTAVPDDVCRWMQIQSAYFATQMVGCRISKSKAQELALALSTPVKK